MTLKNKLNIANQVELTRAEEKISKRKAKQLFDSGDINTVEVGAFKGLAFIHAYLFGDIYDFAGQIREGSGRAARNRLDLILKKELSQVIDWNKVDKDDYLSAMKGSAVKDVEIKTLLKNALTHQIDDRVLFMDDEPRKTRKTQKA